METKKRIKELLRTTNRFCNTFYRRRGDAFQDFIVPIGTGKREDTKEKENTKNESI